MSQHVTPEITGPFQKSRHSNTLNGILNCVEVAPTSDGGLALRNSRHPAGAVNFFTRAEIKAFFQGVKENEFGDFSS